MALTDKKCSMPECDAPPRPGQRYCCDCHSKYMRAWRAKRKRREQEMQEELLRLRKRLVELRTENEELKT